jgi:hypothetical protein
VRTFPVHLCHCIRFWLLIDIISIFKITQRRKIEYNFRGWRWERLITQQHRLLLLRLNNNNNNNNSIKFFIFYVLSQQLQGQ